MDDENDEMMNEFSNSKLQAKLTERSFSGLERSLPSPSIRDGMVNLADNDYLCLSHHPALKEAGIEAIEEFGCSASSSPLVTGYGKPHQRLRQRILDWYGTGHAMIWNSGFIANQALFSVLPTKGDWVFADRLIHHSVLAGLMRGEANFTRFPHLDLDFLESSLKKKDPFDGNVFVVTESVFSMDGDCADLLQLAELRERYGFFWVVDEAHALGWYGDNGAGLLEQMGLVSHVDAILGTFGKALGAQGAYLVLRDETWLKFLMNFSGEFIYSTYLPPSSMAVATKAIEVVSGMSDSRHVWQQGSGAFREVLVGEGFMVPDGDSPIVPLLSDDVVTTSKMNDHLRENGILAGFLRPPTVPQGASRNRFSLKANLAFKDVALRIGQTLKNLHA